MKNKPIIFKEPHVFIDLETTGTNQKYDRIIEIGAVRVENDTETDRFQTFVDPQRPLPFAIQRLTGIRPDDLRGAPLIEDIIHRVAEFCSGAILVAHHASFDRSFLMKAGFPKGFTWLDSIPMFLLLRPDLTHHKLNNLIRLANVREKERHRGEDDARDLFKTLIYFFTHSDFPQALADDLLRILTPAKFGWCPHIRRWRESLRSEKDGYFRKIKPHTEQTSSETTSPEFDPDAVGAAFKPGGDFLRGDRMAYRPQQAEMAKAVAETFQAEGFRLIEAGTGTGKSLAYLYPAVRWSMATGRPVAVSTHTKLLQHQIADRELPKLAEITGLKLKWMILKGRENYLCVRKLHDAIAQLKPGDPESRRFVLAFLLANLWHSKGRGDLNSTNYIIKMNYKVSFDIFPEVASTSRDCDNTDCRFYGICAYYSRIRKARNVHILVVNHALSLKWPKDYPQIDDIVFDEAHNLEDDATNAYGDSYAGYTFAALKRLLFTEHDTSAASHLSRWIENANLSPDLKNSVRQIIENCRSFQTRMSRFESDLIQFALTQYPMKPVETVTDDPYDETVSAVIDPSLQTKPMQRLKNAGARLIDASDNLLNSIIKFFHQFTINPSIKLNTDIRDTLTALTKHINELRRFMKKCLESSGGWNCRWVEFPSEKHAQWTIQIQPVTVSGLLRGYVWSRLRSAVLTSATIETFGSDLFIKKRIGLHQIKQNRLLDFVRLGSPFDFRENMLAVILYDRLSLHNTETANFVRSRSDIIEEIAVKLNGRTLYLGTARKRIELASEQVRFDLAKAGIDVIVQSGGNLESLLQRFRDEGKAVLMGVDTLWEGVDIPGPALSAVLIEKIPFPPMWPIIEARIDHLNRIGRNGFTGYCLPRMIIRLRQGIGRLIRGHEDRGCVILMAGGATERKNHSSAVQTAFPVEPIDQYPWNTMKSFLYKWLEDKCPFTIN